MEKKIKGRKRHIVTDTQGNLLHVKVHAANIHDTIAGPEIIKSVIERYQSLEGISADSGYKGTTERYVKNILGKTIEISSKIASGWAVVAKRWIVERTFAWFNGFRRLAKDYEISTRSSENFIRISHIFLLIKRVV